MKSKADNPKTRDRQSGNRYFIDNAFLKTWGAKLGPHCIAVYNVLVMHANADSQTAFPSFQTIGDMTGMSRRQAVREIDKLKTNNIIQVEERTAIAPDTGKSYFLSNIFTLLHPDEWVKIDQSLCEPSDTQSPGVVPDSHQPSDTQSPPLVTGSHPNNTNPNKTQLTTKDKSGGKPPAPPGVIVFIEVTKRHVLNNTQILEIDERVGRDPPALDRWRETVKAWQLAGHKINNISGMLDWFKRGIPIYAQKASTNGTYQNTNRKGIKALEETGESLASERTIDIYTREYVYPDGHREPIPPMS